MVARSGLFVDPVPGTPPVGTAMADGRRVLGAAFGSAFRAMSGGTLTTSGSTMAITVAQSVWVIPDPLDTASCFLSPTDVATVTPAVGPASGSRIDLIVVKQNNVAGGDVDSRASVSLVAGTASASPTAPATPTGAQVIAQVLVPTNAANSSACTITYGVPRGVQAPAQINVTTLALLNSIPGLAVGQEAAVTADGTASNNGLYLWSGSTWVQVATFSVFTAISYPAGTSQPSFGWPIGYKLLGDSVVMRGVIQKTAGTWVAGDVLFNLPFAVPIATYFLANSGGATYASVQTTAAGTALTVHNTKGTAPTWLALDGWEFSIR